MLWFPLKQCGSTMIQWLYQKVILYGNEIHKNNSSAMVLFAISFDTRCTMVLCYKGVVDNRFTNQNPVLLQKCFKFRSGLSTFTWTSTDEAITDCWCFIIRTERSTVHVNEPCLHLYMLLATLTNTHVHCVTWLTVSLNNFTDILSNVSRSRNRIRWH